MILVISWVITACIVGAIITATFVKVNEWIDYRDEEDYSIIWGRGGKKPEPSNKDIDDLRRKFEFLKELTENLNQGGGLMKQISTNLQAQVNDLNERVELFKQISINLQAQIDELTSKVISRPSSEFDLLRTEINNLINDDNEQDNGANSPTN